jgi:hypothetical protein
MTFWGSPRWPSFVRKRCKTDIHALDKDRVSTRLPRYRAQPLLLRQPGLAEAIEHNRYGVSMRDPLDGEVWAETTGLRRLTPRTPVLHHARPDDVCFRAECLQARSLAWTVRRSSIRDKSMPPSLRRARQLRQGCAHSRRTHGRKVACGDGRADCSARARNRPQLSRMGDQESVREAR